jgi:chorismate mutase
MTQAKTLSLEDIRAKLDAIDTQILKLVDDRAKLSSDVADAKRAMGDGDKFALRPGRESQILRRLLGLDRQAASASLVVRIWREIIGANLYNQTPFHIAAWGGARSSARVTELARQRFGAAPALILVDEPEQAISTAKGSGGVAVLALESGSWWWGKLLLDPTMAVIGILPEVTAWGQPAALAVAQVTLEPSGPGDETLWVTDSAKSAFDIEIQMSQDGVGGRLLAEAGGLKLFALSGFYQRDDERLARAPGRMTGVIGVAPGPFDL